MIKYCCNCVYPETKPDLTFDEDGVCDACRFANVKDATDWDSRRKELVEVFNKFKSRFYPIFRRASIRIYKSQVL